MGDENHNYNAKLAKYPDVNAENYYTMINDFIDYYVTQHNGCIKILDKNVTERTIKIITILKNDVSVKTITFDNSDDYNKALSQSTNNQNTSIKGYNISTRSIKNNLNDNQPLFSSEVSEKILQLNYHNINIHIEVDGNVYFCIIKNNKLIYKILKNDMIFTEETRVAEKARLAEEEAEEEAEEARLAKEARVAMAEEEARLVEEEAEEARLAKEARVAMAEEEARLAEEEVAEKAKLAEAARQKAEEAARQKADEARVAEEAARQKANEARVADEARVAEDTRLAEAKKIMNDAIIVLSRAKTIKNAAIFVLSHKVNELMKKVSSQMKISTDNIEIIVNDMTKGIRTTKLDYNAKKMEEALNNWAENVVNYGVNKVEAMAIAKVKDVSKKAFAVIEKANAASSATENADNDAKKAIANTSLNEAEILLNGANTLLNGANTSLNEAEILLNEAEILLNEVETAVTDMVNANEENKNLRRERIKKRKFKRREAEAKEAEEAEEARLAKAKRDTLKKLTKLKRKAKRDTLKKLKELKREANEESDPTNKIETVSNMVKTIEARTTYLVKELKTLTRSYESYIESDNNDVNTIKELLDKFNTLYFEFDIMNRKCENMRIIFFDIDTINKSMSETNFKHFNTKQDHTYSEYQKLMDTLSREKDEISRIIKDLIRRRPS
jgi:hypothetical protein